MYDPRNLKSLKLLAQYAPEAMAAYRGLQHAAAAEGALDSKAKALIALACAHVVRCPYSIDTRLAEARAAGAHEAEIAEAVLVAAAVQAGATVMHGSHCYGTPE